MEPISRDECATACVTAMGNSKDIQTAFLRLDEERAERKAAISAIEPGVSFKVFSWVVGSMAAAALVILPIVFSVMWGTFSSQDSIIENKMQHVSSKLSENTGKIDVLVSRIDDFKDDQNRVLSKLDEISKTVNNIQIKIGKMED